MAKSTRDAEGIGGAYDATHYREYATQINELADGERDIGLRNKLRAIGNQYQALADYLYPQP